jgi:hypothetical protein
MSLSFPLNYHYYYYYCYCYCYYYYSYSYYYYYYYYCYYYCYYYFLILIIISGRLPALGGSAGVIGGGDGICQDQDLERGPRLGARGSRLQDVRTGWSFGSELCAAAWWLCL